MKRKLPVDNLNQKSILNVIDKELILNKTIVSSSSSLMEDGTKPSDLMSRLITKEIRLCAEQLDIDYEELEAWITLQSNIPAKSILHALRIARQYKLDPLQEEVLLTKYQEEWQVSISVNGWIKLINMHPHFSGLTFVQSSEEKEGLPIWMECTIHRSDRAIPTTIREYMNEVRHETEIWQKMPRRMLRHRVLQQCARIALSIQLSESKTEKKPIDLNQESNNFHVPSNKITHHQASGGCKLLKEKLRMKTCLRERGGELG
jgi:hypothetical protein